MDPANNLFPSRRTLQPPRRPEATTSALAASSLGSALSSLSQDAFAKPAAPLLRRTIPQRTIAPPNPIEPKAASSRPNPADLLRQPGRRGLQERRAPLSVAVANKVERNQDVKARVNENREKQNLTRAPLVDSSKMMPPAKVQQPELEQLVKTLAVSASSDAMVNQDEYERLSAEYKAARDEFERKLAAQDEKYATIALQCTVTEQKLTEAEATRKEQVAKLEASLQTERQDRMAAFEKLAFERDQAREMVELLQKQLLISQELKADLEVKRQEEIRKRSSLECALSVREDEINSLEKVVRQLAQVKVRLAERDAAISSSQDENRSLLNEVKRRDLLLEAMTRELNESKARYAEAITQLACEREKVSLQRGYLMKRGLNDGQ